MIYRMQPQSQKRGREIGGNLRAPLEVILWRDLYTCLRLVLCLHLSPPHCLFVSLLVCPPVVAQTEVFIWQISQALMISVHLDLILSFFYFPTKKSRKTHINFTYFLFHVVGCGGHMVDSSLQRQEKWNNKSTFFHVRVLQDFTNTWLLVCLNAPCLRHSKTAISVRSLCWLLLQSFSFFCQIPVLWREWDATSTLSTPYKPGGWWGETETEQTFGLGSVIPSVWVWRQNKDVNKYM